MKDVPYYRHRIPPEFFKGKGWRGLLVRVLNYFRHKIQAWCSYHVMLLLADRYLPDDRDRPETIEALKIRWKEEQDETSVRRPVLGVFGQLGAEFTLSRYAEGRKNGKWPEDVPSDPTSERFARYVRGAHQAPYTQARDSMIVQEPEWEVVE